MTWPGWDSIEEVKRIASDAEITAVILLIVVALLELVALLWKRREKLFIVLALVALLLLAGVDQLANHYNHRKDLLYDQRENSITQNLQKKANDAAADAKDARSQAKDAQRVADELKYANAYRGLSSKQREKMLALLRANGPASLYFVTSPDPESQHFFAEIANVLTSAGWKLEMHPYNWGTLETYPAGVQVWVGDTKQAPRGASVLQSALTNIGVQAPGWNFFMLEKQDKFALYLGPKPLQK